MGCHDICDELLAADTGTKLGQYLLPRYTSMLHGHCHYVEPLMRLLVNRTIDIDSELAIRISFDLFTDHPYSHIGKSGTSTNLASSSRHFFTTSSAMAYPYRMSDYWNRLILNYATACSRK